MPGTIAATRSFMKILFHCACWEKETQRLEMNGLLHVSQCVSSAPAAAVRVSVPISSFVLLNMQYFLFIVFFVWVPVFMTPLLEDHTMNPGFAFALIQ